MGIHWSNIAWPQLILTHFSCAMLILAILLFAFHWIIQKIRQRNRNDLLLRWLLLLPVGITGIYLFFINLFFPEASATVMGWKVSPFQIQVGIASLAFGLLGIFSFKPAVSYGFRVATVLAVSIWMWGHALYQIYQIIITSNIYLGNAVSWFWVDVLLPFILINLIRKAKISPLMVVGAEHTTQDL